MDARDSTFFASLARDERMLKSHGFDAWPDVDDLTRYACDLENALQALADAFGVRLARDVRGSWIVVAKSEEVI